jgi:hypothetical protein
VLQLKLDGVSSDASGTENPYGSLDPPMSDTDQIVDEPQEAVAPAVPRPGDEHAYEDTWYQVLKQQTEDRPDPS